MLEGADDSGRPKRNKKQSLKAQEILESGKSVPGLPLSDSPPRLSSPDTEGSATRSHFSTSASLGKMAPVSSVRTAATIITNHGAISVPTFAANEFMIYDWKIPRPNNFINLPDSYKSWKRETDRQERARDIDDGSDDWYEFCGDPAMYPDRGAKGSAMCTCVGRMFVNRAKRAFWAGKSWTEFETEERTIDSEYHARAEQNPRKRIALLSTALHNELRLAVFDTLKVRLSEEIWLQPYRIYMSFSERTPAREDSKVPTPSPLAPNTIDPRDMHARRAPTVEEMSRGITGWSIDSLGIAQPLYGKEREPPNGMRNFMEDMREQASREREETGLLRYDAQESIGARKRHARGQGVRMGNVGVNRIIPMTAAEEIARGDLNFDTSSEEDQ